ncbi:proprotein convertase P-domain-containing protein, partial [Stenotrophomonas sp. 3diitr2024]|uniref:proprotein convertase P-domain-containing protein n=1 Tax=Stenotrophomonas sp. 3diitr2024 TaxID=3345115 RepID=UPI0035CC97AC
FQLANGARNIESVQLGFRVNHRNTRQLQFVLVSPSGTRSVVQPAFTWPKDAATSAFSLFNACGILCMIVGIGASRRLADRFGKRDVFGG